ncbi:N-acetylneuraminate synthase [Paenibacillus hodogayensis]|uniref:N-acetylneuraminate synthase n=1 Tax=Paenibacillus hodogayensis TaxID=279208 RepID=A0ABV5W458_9BACL
MSGKTFVIAEAGVNHNGSLEMALELVDAARECGADAVKFQTFRAEKLASRHAPKAAYQMKTTAPQQSQLEMLKRLELTERMHEALIDRCARKGIEFLSTPFDPDSAKLLAVRFNLRRLKISSGDLTNAPLLYTIASMGKPVIASTGMSTLSDIESALSVLAFGYMNLPDKPSVEAFRKAYESDEGQSALRDNVRLLHCTTEYPSPIRDVNLRAIDTLRSAFGLEVGYSDHTPGIAVSIAAVARGASLIEKHMTLNRQLPGPDHQASLEPNELRDMIIAIRQVESALGTPRKLAAESERSNREMARKSLVAAASIRRGEIFTERNLTVKRPGTGIAPIWYWDWIGKRAERDYAQDEVVR